MLTRQVLVDLVGGVRVLEERVELLECIHGVCTASKSTLSEKFRHHQRGVWVPLFRVLNRARSQWVRLGPPFESRARKPQKHQLAGLGIGEAQVNLQA